jgi:hypothetical protein
LFVKPVNPTAWESYTANAGGVQASSGGCRRAAFRAIAAATEVSEQDWKPRRKVRPFWKPRPSKAGAFFLPTGNLGNLGGNNDLKNYIYIIYIYRGFRTFRAFQRDMDRRRERGLRGLLWKQRKVRKPRSSLAVRAAAWQGLEVAPCRLLPLSSGSESA